MAPNQSKVADHFPLFTKLPPEIRILIWEAALPRRLIKAGCSGVEKLGPPAVAQVCCESRATALRHGSPQLFECFHADFSATGLTWLDTSRDTIIWECFCRFLYPPVDEGCFPPSVPCATSFICTGDDKKFVSAADISHFLRSKRVENARCFNIAIGGNGKFYNIHTPALKPEAEEAIFGGDSYRMVDLTDEEEVEFVSQILYRSGDTALYGSKLVKAHAFVRRPPNIPKEQPGLSITDHFYRGSWNWDNYMRDIRYQWVLEYYGRRNVELFTILKNNKHKIDEDYPWINAALASLPQIRPVYLLVRRQTNKSLYRKGSGEGNSKRDKVWWNGHEWERKEQG